MKDSTGPRPFGKWASRLAENGYMVVPAVGKRVLLKDWTRYQYSPADTERFADHNIGILTRFTPTLDIDVRDPVAVEAIRALLPQGVPIRYGRKGFAMPFQLGAGTAPFKKIAVDLRAPDGGHDRVEFLADGQQVIVEGIHPDTGKPYQWNGAGDLATVPLADLPVTNIGHARGLIHRIVEALQSMGYLLVTDAPPAVQKAAGEAIEAARGLPPMPKVDGLPDVLWRALDTLDPTPREQWIAVGHHLKAIGAGWAHDAWVEWSRRSPAYQPGDEDRWDTFQPDRSGGQHALRVMAGVPEPMAFEPEPEAEQTPPPKAKRTMIEWPEDAKPRPIQWLVEGVLERDSVGIIWGDPGTYKSFIGLSLVLSVAYGHAWHGRRVEQGEAIIIAGEGAAGLHRRIEAWKRANGIVESLGGRLGISRGAIVLNDETRKNVTTLIAEIVATGKRPRVIMVDTVARNMAGNENSQEDMGRLVECIDMLRHAFPGATVILVHHANKQGGLRGSTVLLGAADFEYLCVRKAPLRVEFTCGKMKDAEQPDPMPLQGSVVDLGEHGDSLAFAPGLMVTEMEEAGMLDAQVLGYVAKCNEEGRRPLKKEVIEALGRRKGDVVEAIDSLKARGQLKGGEGRGMGADGMWVPAFDHLYD